MKLRIYEFTSFIAVAILDNWTLTNNHFFQQMCNNRYGGLNFQWHLTSQETTVSRSTFIRQYTQLNGEIAQYIKKIKNLQRKDCEDKK